MPGHDDILYSEQANQNRFLGYLTVSTEMQRS